MNFQQFALLREFIELKTISEFWRPVNMSGKKWLKYMVSYKKTPSFCRQMRGSEIQCLTCVGRGMSARSTT